jgi:hypothetical protein
MEVLLLGTPLRSLDTQGSLPLDVKVYGRLGKLFMALLTDVISQGTQEQWHMSVRAGSC